MHSCGVLYCTVQHHPVPRVGTTNAWLSGCMLLTSTYWLHVPMSLMLEHPSPIQRKTGLLPVHSKHINSCNRVHPSAIRPAHLLQQAGSLKAQA